MSGETDWPVTIGECRRKARRDFFELLVRQAEHSVRRAEVCRGYDPVCRKSLAEAQAELALTRIAAAPALEQGGGGY